MVEDSLYVAVFYLDTSVAHLLLEHGSDLANVLPAAKSMPAAAAVSYGSLPN